MKTRIVHEDGTITEQKYHPNGVIASEMSLIDKRPHGMTRGWHPNGVLASEIPLDHGILDGSVRQWNEKGELLRSRAKLNYRIIRLPLEPIALFFRFL